MVIECSGWVRYCDSIRNCLCSVLQAGVFAVNALTRGWEWAVGEAVGCEVWFGMSRIGQLV